MGRGQELLDAARNGDKKTVEKILNQITKRSGPFTSLRRGAGVNVQDDNGYTPLHHACLNGHKEIVRLLLSADASPCVVDKKGATPLHLAAWKGDSNVVAMLLAHKNPPVNIDQVTSDHETALLIAAHFGYADVVAQLMARGADVSVQNIKGESALDLACQFGRLETVQHLLCVMPQLVAAYRSPKCIGKVFSSTPLHRASKYGRKEVVSALLAAGVDPNVQTFNGTPLHEAACFGKASVVRILLTNGANIKAVDRTGKTVQNLLDDYSEEATRRVRRVIREFENHTRVSYENEEYLPPFPVPDCSPTGYPTSAIMCSEPESSALSPRVKKLASLNNTDTIELPNITADKKYKTISPSMKNDIIKLSKYFSISRIPNNDLNISEQMYANYDEIDSNTSKSSYNDICGNTNVYENLTRSKRDPSIIEHDIGIDFKLELTQKLHAVNNKNRSPTLTLKRKPKPLPKPGRAKNTESMYDEDDDYIGYTSFYRNSFRKDTPGKYLVTNENGTHENCEIQKEHDSLMFDVNVRLDKGRNLPDDEKAKSKEMHLRKKMLFHNNAYVSMNNSGREVEHDSKQNSIYTSMNKAQLEMTKSEGTDMCDHRVKFLDYCSRNSKQNEKLMRADTEFYENLETAIYTPMDLKTQIRRRSNPAISQRIPSVHTKGARCCIYEALDYLYLYELNPDAILHNAHPFIKRKEKATSIPCICLGTKQKKDTNRDKGDRGSSQLIYYSCENIYVQFSENKVYSSLTDLRKCNNAEINITEPGMSSSSNNEASNHCNDTSEENVVFRPFVKLDQSESNKADREISLIIKKKFQHIKQLFTDW